MRDEELKPWRLNDAQLRKPHQNHQHDADTPNRNEPQVGTGIGINQQILAVSTIAMNAFPFKISMLFPDR